MKRTLYYLFYYFLAKHLPRSYELGLIGKWSSRVRRLVCRPLFQSTEGFFSVERGADFGGGRNIIMREYAAWERTPVSWGQAMSPSAGMS